jgi:hypothetical protein
VPRRFKRGVGPSTRGRHRKHRSRETRKRSLDQLIPPRPERMSETTYSALAGLRRVLDNQEKGAR